MTQPGDWPKRLTASIAAQLQRLREGKMSAQQLADATAALGHPIARSVIANLESGRRDAISVAELLVLARALRVPPLQLVLPIGHGPTVELLPGTVADTWDAAQWITGEGPFPPSDSILEDVDDWKDSPVSYFREQMQLIDDWFRAHRDVTVAREQGTTAEAEAAERRREVVGDQIRRHRVDMRKQGLDPGGLPPHLMHIEHPVGDDGER